MKLIVRDFTQPTSVDVSDYPKLVETDAGHRVGNKDIEWKQDFVPFTYRYYLWSDQDDKMISLDARYVIESREGLQAMTTLYGHRYKVSGDKSLNIGSGPTAVVFFAQNLDESAILINEFCTTELEHISDASSAGRLNVIAEHCPASRPFLARWQAKRELLAQINTNDAVANLEKQVDVLCELVFALADMAAEKPSWYDTFKQSVRSSSSASPSDELIEKMKNEKSRLRSLVEKYVQQRG